MLSFAMHPMFSTMAGRACIQRLVGRALREGLSVQEFGAAYRVERGWGDPSVASLLECWAEGENPSVWAAEREMLSQKMERAVETGDLAWSDRRDERFPDNRWMEAKTPAGKALIGETNKTYTSLRLREDQWYARFAQAHAAGSVR